MVPVITGSTFVCALPTAVPAWQGQDGHTQVLQLPVSHLELGMDANKATPWPSLNIHAPEALGWSQESQQLSIAHIISPDWGLKMASGKTSHS